MKFKSKTYLVILPLMLALTSCSLADNERKMVREGNKFYQDSTYDKAEVLYRKALDYNPTSFAANYNIANVTYKQEKYANATRKYKRLLDSLETKQWKAAANHNLGNSYLHEKKVDEAIEAYKESLRNNPADMETKYNLAYAMQLKEQQQQNQDKNGGGQNDKQNQGQGDKNQDQSQNQNKEDQQSQNDNKPQDGDNETKPQPKPDASDDKEEQKDREEKQGKKQDNDKQQGYDGEEQKQDAQPKDAEKGDQNPEEQQQTPSGISKKDAENILDAIAVEEKDTQEKVDKEKARKIGVKRNKKNW